MGWHSLVGTFTSTSRDIANYAPLSTVARKSSFIDIFAKCTKATTASPTIEVVTTNESGLVLSATQFTLTGMTRRAAADNLSGDWITIRYSLDLASLHSSNIANKSLSNKVLIGVTGLDGASSVKIYALSYAAEGGRS